MRAPKWRLQPKDLVVQIKRSKQRSSGGMCGIENGTFHYAVQKDDEFHFIRNVSRYMRVAIEQGIPDVMAESMRRANGVALGKPGKDGFDTDVRPLVIFDSYMRLEDSLAWKNVPKDERQAAVGPNQLCEATDGVGKANAALRVVDHVLERTGDRALVIKDAANAFNQMDRGHTLELVRRHTPDFIHWNWALYGGPMNVRFDDEHSLKMTQGKPQGLPSSPSLYAMAKYDVEWRTDRETKRRMAEMNITCSENEYAVRNPGQNKQLTMMEGRQKQMATNMWTLIQRR